MPRRRRRTPEQVAPTVAPNARLEAPSSEAPPAAAAEMATAAATLAAPEQEDPQVLALRAFAATMGYVVQKVDTWTDELAHMMACGR